MPELRDGQQNSFWSEVRQSLVRTLKSNQILARTPPKKPRAPRRPAILKLSALKAPPPSKTIDALRFWFAFAILEIATIWAATVGLGRFGSVAGATVAILIAGYVFWFAPRFALARYGGQELSANDHWRVRKCVEAWTQVIPIAPQVEFFLSDSQSLFSVAITQSLRNGKIVMSRTLLNKLTEDELFYLVGFELGKIQSGYARAATYAMGLGQIWDWPGLGWIASLFIRFTMGTSRLTSGASHRVYGLDEWMADCSLSRDFWSRTIFNLAEMSRLLPPSSTRADSCLDPMCSLTATSSDQYRRDGRWVRLFRSQPQSRDRIVKLIGHYPP